MTNLSVISANAYPGFSQVEFLLRNLAAQTFRDFETVLIDMFYAENASAVRDLCTTLGLTNVVHAPACEARHVAPWLPWELYSNALLLASSEWVLHYGVKRYMHPQAVGVVASQADAGICTVLIQKNVPEN